MKQVKVVISGLVQGVGFRAYVISLSRSLKVTGWVKNLPRGGVEVVAQGREKELTKLIQALKIGPTAAVVSSTDIKWQKVGQRLTDFVIKY